MTKMLADDCLIQVLLFLNISAIELGTSLVNKQWNECSSKYYTLQHHQVVQTSSKEDDNNAIQKLITHLREHGYHNIHKQLLLSEFSFHKNEMMNKRYEASGQETLEITDPTEVTGVYNMYRSVPDDSFSYDYYSYVLCVPQESKLLYYTTHRIESMRSRYSSSIALQTRRNVNRLSTAFVKLSEYTDQEYLDRFKLWEYDLNKIQLYRDRYIDDKSITKQEYEEYRDEILSAYDMYYETDDQDIIWKNKIYSIESEGEEYYNR
jgi:hypothetical protein